MWGIRIQRDRPPSIMDNHIWSTIWYTLLFGIMAHAFYLMCTEATAPLYKYILYAVVVVFLAWCVGDEAIKCHNIYNKQKISWETIATNRIYQVVNAGKLCWRGLVHMYRAGAFAAAWWRRVLGFGPK